MIVSVITPSLNQGIFIEDTLRSVAAQNGPQVEHLVMDGGSIDATLDILTRWQPSLRWVSKPDNGQAAALNEGIRLSNGDIIGWLNSDDIYYPSTIAKVCEYFSVNPSIDIVFGMANHIDRDGHVIELYPTEPWNFERLKTHCFICQPAVFFRRHIVEVHGPFNESLHYCMDYEYWLRLGKAGVKFSYMTQLFAGSRLYSENKTVGSRVSVHAEINDMLRTMLGVVPDRWLLNYAYAVVEQGIKKQGNLVGLDRARIALQAISSALRWNKSISPSLLRKILRGGSRQPAIESDNRTKCV